MLRIFLVLALAMSSGISTIHASDTDKYIHPLSDPRNWDFEGVESFDVDSVRRAAG